jgi:purine nucleosidase
MLRFLNYASRSLSLGKTPSAPHAILCFLLLIFYFTPVNAEDFNRLILDTDLSPDVDDAGAVAVLHTLADQGRVQILAMMISSGDPWSAPCLDALNTSFGRPNIPIGVNKFNAVTHVSKYTKYIAEHYPNTFSKNIEPPEALKLYRKILVSQPAGSVTVVSIGYLSNLSHLLESGPDEYSPLDGKTLVMEKVKRLICMGGEFPSGKEWNFYQDANAAANVVSHWPTPAIFCGFEIGNKIMTGHALQNAAENNPLRKAYLLYNNLANRQSWDQIAAFLAGYLDDTPYKYLDISERGVVQVDQKGNNTWEARKDGPHRFIIPTAKTKDLAHIIDDLMLGATYATPH